MAIIWSLPKRLCMNIKEMSEDKTADKERYNKFSAEVEIDDLTESEDFPWLAEYLREPYYCYRTFLKSELREHMQVLEIGSGIGNHTQDIIKNNVNLLATDISHGSLRVLQKRYENLNTSVADIENLPFKRASFDAVCSAGVFSYADHDVLFQELNNVLKPNGLLICVDSLNNNPVYKANRYIHYLKNNRSKNSIERIPSMDTLKYLDERFELVRVKFFGSISWLSPLLSRLIGMNATVRFSRYIDKRLDIDSSAFKFVAILNKRT